MENFKYIVVCLSRSEGESENFRVMGPGGKGVFDTAEEANAVMDADIREYAEAEREAGRTVEICGNHIVWMNDDSGEYEAKWYVYGVDCPQAARNAIFLNHKNGTHKYNVSIDATVGADCVEDAIDDLGEMLKDHAEEYVVEVPRG